MSRRVYACRMARATTALGFGSLLLLSAAIDGCHSSANTEDAGPAAPASAPAPVVSATPAAPAASASALTVVGGDATSPTPRAAPALREAVSALSRKVAEYGGQLGVAVVDVTSGDLLAAQGDRVPLNPASNAKLFTAAAALGLLHGNYRFETGLYGEQSGSTVSKLVLRGHGDPSLATRDLWDMVEELKANGVRRVDGDILVDQRFFDDDFVPPAFEQQPNEWASFRAPVSAIALDENTLTMNVRPGAVEAAAIVSFEPPGFVDIDGEVKTTAAGTPQNVRLELSANGYRMSAHVSGTIGAQERAMEFTRRVDNPALLAGYALKALFVASGIAVNGAVKPGGEQQRRALVLHRSRPLASMLDELGKASDNFYAEMVFKTVGAEQKGRPGKSANGAEAVTRYLRDIGAFEEGTVFRNGSGLFDADRVTASETAKLLRAAYLNPSLAPEYLAQLAVGGVDGTLHRRFRDLKDKRIVRAKTGTLEAAAALSGYVLAPPGRSPIAFSILVNHIAGKVSDARAAIDHCVDEIVRHVWREEHDEKPSHVMR
jgi:D-alanyl-D-alanine carboxypeptidase/D-alanyl-D-alanine-endopeptidase (penicillin-binding protein 4)